MPSPRLPPGHAARTQLYCKYTGRARKEQKEFSLSKEEFATMTSADCHYCGSPPQQSHYNRKTSNSGPYIYNGIDRVDSKKGYTVDNCVPCCKVCNFMKSNLMPEEFIEHIKKILLYYQNDKIN